ncbi:MAG: CDP-alcohol phosphatidyltransferase family protein [Alloprevotella sp.]|nr:CDP-alcohol phosphatidyltransferase family protein [Alloprevotella sp.]
MSKDKPNEFSFSSTLKSLDTEEWLDLHFTRPLGYMWAKFFNRLGIHPNVVTIISIFLGAAAGALFYPENIWLNLLGVLLLVWANIYDSCDGQLARLSGKKTRLGRVLDGFAGDVWFFSIYVFISLRLTPTWGIWIWILCSVAGFIFHGKQAQLADYYRNIHLFFLKGEGGSELDNSTKLTKEYQSISWNEDFIWKLFLYFYRNYTRSQEQMTPQFQGLYARLKAQYPDGNLPQELCERFCEGSRPLMKWTNILTFNTRAIVLYLSVLVGQPWTFPAFEISILTIIFIYMRLKHERLCREIANSL